MGESAGTAASAERQELSAVRRENRQLREGHKILKRPTASCASADFRGE